MELRTKDIQDFVDRCRDAVNDEEELYNSEFINRGDDWSKLWSALDAIDDTAAAMGNFEEKRLGDCEGERYLRLYGFLQGVCLQQDALVTLRRVLLGRDTKSKKKSAWSQLRNFRNTTVAHAFEGMEDGYFGIVRYSLATDEIRRVKYPSKAKGPKSDTYHSYKLRLLYDAYVEEYMSLAKEVEDKLREIAASRSASS